MKVENLTERIWCMDKEPVLTAAVVDKYSELRAEINHFKYAHGVYLDGKKLVIIMLIALRSSLEPDMEKECFDVFHRHLRHFDTGKFSDLLFSIDSYMLSHDDYFMHISRLPKAKPDFRRRPIVDDLLKDSRGVLLWHHQLENLYLFSSHDREDAVKFRKGILSKKPEFLETASDIAIDAKTSLKDCIMERMIFGATTLPAYRAARDLYQYLNKD